MYYRRSLLKFLLEVVYLQSYISFKYTENESVMHITDSWHIYMFVCIHSFSYSLPMQIISEYWIEFSVPCSRSLLVTYFMYCNVYMLIQISKFITSPKFSPLVTTIFILRSVDLFLFCKNSSFVWSFIRFHT